MFAEALPQQENLGATHLAVQAHAVIGRTMFDAIGTATAPGVASRQTIEGFQQPHEA